MERRSTCATIAEKFARLTFDDLAPLDIERYDHEPLLPRVWGLWWKVTAYDAVYVAPAEVALPEASERDRSACRTEVGVE